MRQVSTPHRQLTMLPLRCSERPCLLGRTGGKFGGNHGEHRRISATYREPAPEHLCSICISQRLVAECCERHFGSICVVPLPHPMSLFGAISSSESDVCSMRTLS